MGFCPKVTVSRAPGRRGAAQRVVPHAHFQLSAQLCNPAPANSIQTLNIRCVRDLFFLLSAARHTPATMSAAAARQTLRNFAAWANKIDANKAAHTPIVIGAVGVSCIGSYAIQAAVSKDSA